MSPADAEDERIAEELNPLGDAHAIGRNREQV